ncbi:MAG: hypothetical protein N3D20_02170 [Candidatus Pacearchaeota archaeon]|nr:hypothetical protein [Candidatus Pacearchaeota archaeon]
MEKGKNNKMGKRGQIAIYVIIAVIIVVGFLVFLFMRERFVPVPSVEVDLKSGIEKCVRDSVNEATDIMLPQGGFIEPKNYKLFNKTKITYLCENAGNYKPCINQHPMLINEINNEILIYAEPKIENCINNLIFALKRKNYEIKSEKTNISISMTKGKIIVDVEKKIIASKGETKISFDKFLIEITNPAYDLINVAIEIVNNEAKYCSFEYTGYMMMYPEIDIRLYVTSDSVKLYSLKDISSGKKMNFAVRGCVIPVGF